MNKYTSTELKQLTSKTANELTKVKISVLITWNGVLQAATIKVAENFAKSKKEEDKESLITTKDDAKDKPNHKMRRALQQSAMRRKLF